jgi:hypothetical protein
MADFSDAEDALLYQVAIREWSQKGKIEWNKVCVLFASTGKTRRSLQQRLTTLKRTYGNDLSRFRAKFSFARRPTALSSRQVHQIVDEIFRDIKKSHVHQSSGQMHLNSGEIRPESMSIVVERLGKVSTSDVFVDIGSGIGNVLVQVSLETSVGLCIGVDLRRDVVQLSQTILLGYQSRYPRLKTILQFGEDLLQLQPSTMNFVSKATILYASCQLFEPVAQIHLMQLIASLPNLRLVVSSVKFCPRHTSRCLNPVCGTFSVQADPVSVHGKWANKPFNFYVYDRKI